MHLQHALALHHTQAQPLQSVHALLLRQWHTNHLGGTGHTQSDRCALGQRRLHIADRATACVGRATNLQHQLGNALNVLHRVLRVHAALKTVPRICREIKAPRAAHNRLGPPEGGFDVDVVRVVAHRCGVATHDARQGLHGLLVSNHAHLLIQSDGVAIEQLERFARLGPAHLQTAVDFVQVKNVRRPPQLEHHVVGNIHQRRHAALAATLKALHHPRRCLRLRIDAAHDAP